MELQIERRNSICTISNGSCLFTSYRPLGNTLFIKNIGIGIANNKDVPKSETDDLALVFLHVNMKVKKS